MPVSRTCAQPIIARGMRPGGMRQGRQEQRRVAKLILEPPLALGHVDRGVDPVTGFRRGHGVSGWRLRAFALLKNKAFFGRLSNRSRGGRPAFFLVRTIRRRGPYQNNRLASGLPVCPFRRGPRRLQFPKPTLDRTQPGPAERHKEEPFMSSESKSSRLSPAGRAVVEIGRAHV